MKKRPISTIVGQIFTTWRHQDRFSRHCPGRREPPDEHRGSGSSPRGEWAGCPHEEKGKGLISEPGLSRYANWREKMKLWGVWRYTLCAIRCAIRHTGCMALWSGQLYGVWRYDVIWCISIYAYGVWRLTPWKFHNTSNMWSRSVLDIAGKSI